MLLHGQKIGQTLRRMIARIVAVHIGAHGVDDGNGGVLGESLDVSVLIGTDHDDINHAREHAGRILNRLLLAKVNVARAQHEGMAAQQGGRRLKRYARARGVLLENHAE